ncbi:MAG: right-handed parallel beta-helix repeat-containing protein, partial [Nostocoides sp.]
QISGARTDTSGAGGAAVQMSGQGSDGAGRGTTLEVTDSQFDRNAWAGIAVGGAHRVSILKGVFSHNGQCGVCFLDTSSGSVQDSTFTDDTVGLGATGSSRPTWVANTVTGGTVGLQLDGTAAPTIDGVTVSGASRAAIIFSGHSGGAITHATCLRVSYGIVVSPTAAPTLGDNTCGVVRGK